MSAASVVFDRSRGVADVDLAGGELLHPAARAGLADDDIDARSSSSWNSSATAAEMR